MTAGPIQIVLEIIISSRWNTIALNRKIESNAGAKMMIYSKKVLINVTKQWNITAYHQDMLFVT